MRADYSTGSDEAWAAFCGTLCDSELEFFEDQAPNPTPGDGDGDDGEMQSGAGDEGSEDDDDEGNESSLALFAPLFDAARFGDISSLHARHIRARALGSGSTLREAEAEGRSTDYRRRMMRAGARYGSLMRSHAPMGARCLSARPGTSPREPRDSTLIFLCR